MQNDLEAIEKRLLSVTPGGWFVDRRYYFRGISPVVSIANDAQDSAFIAFGLSENDAEYIVQSRQDVHNLITEIRELRKVVADLGIVISDDGCEHFSVSERSEVTVTRVKK